jgi:choline-sulfatase
MPTMSESSSRRPPVLFLVLDSMRTDRLALYGHDRSTTPNLDRLAERATVYENAVAPASWTLPSHSSMFTGLTPSEHGVTNGFLDTTGALRLPDGTTPLAAALRDRGYRTAGFSNNPWVGQLSGLDTGFDEFLEWNLEIGRDGGTDIHTRRDRLYSRGHSLLGHAARQPLFLLKRRFFTSNLVERATRWLGATDEYTDAPSFTFLNLMEAHSPYFPPKSAFRELDLPVPGPVEPRLLNTRLLAYVMGKTALTEERRERVLEYYDASLRYQDRKVGDLLAAFEARVDFDDALIVVCSDHGKTLGEYDRDGTPPHYLRDININVPLIVKYPGQSEGRRVDDPVELRRLYDLVRTGGARPLEADAGIDEYALVEEFVPHTGREDTEVVRWRALVGQDYKYIRNEDGDSFLVERTGVGQRERPCDASEVKQELATDLDARVADLSTGPATEDQSQTEQEFGSDVEAQLEDLGYL